MWKEEVKDIFDFNRSQRRGIYALLGLLVIVIAFRILLPTFTGRKTFERKLIAQSAATLDQQVQGDSAERSFNPDQSQLLYAERSYSLTEFDPNGLTAEGWQSLGFSEKQSRAILNYKSKSGGFKSKKDLDKVFVISDQKLEELWPYILLPDSLEQKVGFKPTEEKPGHLTDNKPAVTIVELNSADTTDLKKVKGIGSYFAKKIVEKRDELGGFYSIYQLTDVWKMTKGKIDTIAPQLTLDISRLRALNINTADASELNAHPYITKKQAETIVAYRMKHGKYTSIEQVKAAAMISDEEFTKLKPYLTCGNEQADE